jgi:hypothetical protein
VRVLYSIELVCYQSRPCMVVIGPREVENMWMFVGFKWQLSFGVGSEGGRKTGRGGCELGGRVCRAPSEAARIPVQTASALSS